MKTILKYIRKRFCKKLKLKDSKHLEPSNFKVGMVIKMNPGYYTKKPYYVLIKEVTETGIITTIPGKHDLKLDMLKDRCTWDYQVSRMTIIGNKESHGHLLLNQQLK